VIFSKPMILSVVSSAFGSTVFAFAEEFQKRQLDLIEKANALGSDGNAEEIEFVRREVAKRAERGLFWTALFAAARDSKTTAVALLLQARADIHEGIYGEKKHTTPLHTGRSAECASLLLAARADPGRFDEYGRTPLHVVAEYGRAEKAKHLIEEKADVNLRVGGDALAEHRNKTPLILAVEGGNSAVMAVLFEAGGLDVAKDISFLVRAEAPPAVECLEKIPKKALSHGGYMWRAHIQEPLRVILEQGNMEYFFGSQEFRFDSFPKYITLEFQNLFTRPEVQASLKYIPGLFASDACNPELLKSLAYTTNDEVFHTHTVAALVQAAWMQTRLATAGEVFVSLLMLPLLCHASFTLRHEQPHFAEPGH
jgi:hypothetical protein